MKLSVISGGRNNGMIQVMSETVPEMEQLLSLVGTKRNGRWGATIVTGNEDEEVSTKATRKRHKKHQFFKQCDVPDCGKLCKGRKGLGLHKYKAHGIGKGGVAVSIPSTVQLPIGEAALVG